MLKYMGKLRSQWRKLADVPDKVDQLHALVTKLSVARSTNYGDSVYRAFVGSEEPLFDQPAPVPFRSLLCRQIHFPLDQYRFWVKAMKDRPRFDRKQWEWVYIAQVLYERGLLMPGSRGVAFGAGQEPLPALFASFGCEVVATDQSLDSAVAGGWAQTNQHIIDLSLLNERKICTDKMFSSLVTFREADMNNIPSEMYDSFDFCWSACSLEHLGSLQKGMDFVVNSMRTLRPGGVAVHTTEFNLSSNEETLEDKHLSIYRRKDIERLTTELERAGYAVEPMDWELGEGLAETVIDLPPFRRGDFHLRLKLGNYVCTSIGIIVQKKN